MTQDSPSLREQQRYLALGKRLRKARAFRCLTQTELSRRVRIEQTRLSAWERGVYSPPCHFLHRLAVELRMRPDYFMGFVDSLYEGQLGGAS